MRYSRVRKVKICDVSVLTKAICRVPFVADNGEGALAVELSELDTELPLRLRLRRGVALGQDELRRSGERGDSETENKSEDPKQESESDGADADFAFCATLEEAKEEEAVGLTKLGENDCSVIPATPTILEE